VASTGTGGGPKKTAALRSGGERLDQKGKRRGGSATGFGITENNVTRNFQPCVKRKQWRRFAGERNALRCLHSAVGCTTGGAKKRGKRVEVAGSGRKGVKYSELRIAPARPKGQGRVIHPGETQFRRKGGAILVSREGKKRYEKGDNGFVKRLRGRDPLTETLKWNSSKIQKKDSKRGGPAGLAARTGSDQWEALMATSERKKSRLNEESCGQGENRLRCGHAQTFESANRGH